MNKQVKDILRWTWFLPLSFLAFFLVRFIVETMGNNWGYFVSGLDDGYGWRISYKFRAFLNIFQIILSMQILIFLSGLIVPKYKLWVSGIMAVLGGIVTFNCEWAWVLRGDDFWWRLSMDGMAIESIIWYALGTALGIWTVFVMVKGCKKNKAEIKSEENS